MIISIERADNQKPQKYSYPSSKINVLIGRNPKPDQGVESITVDEPTASRSHLMMKLRTKGVTIMDLQSSNGTTVNGQKVEPNQWVKVNCGDKIVLGDSQTAITVSKRAGDKQEQNTNKKHDRSSSKSDSSSLSRSREKKKNGNDITSLLKDLKVSESSLKMLQQMTAQKKSKVEKIKFLKLMGCKNVDAHWEQIESYLEGKSKFADRNNSKKAAQELQKQFDSGRGTFQKKGLGRK